MTRSWTYHAGTFTPCQGHVLGTLFKTMQNALYLQTAAPYLFFHVSINDTARGVLDSSEQTLGQMVKDMWAHVGFSLILLVRGKV